MAKRKRRTEFPNVSDNLGYGDDLGAKYSSQWSHPFGKAAGIGCMTLVVVGVIFKLLILISVVKR
jgi:hypothetical protein